MSISIHDTGEIAVLILSAAKIRGPISSNGKTGDEVSLIRYRCIFFNEYVNFFCNTWSSIVGVKTE